MTHLSATYPVQSEAIKAAREVRRVMQINLNVSHCAPCDAYHLIGNAKTVWARPRWVVVLQMLAHGYRDNEIAPMVELTPKGVQWAINTMMDRLHAMSRAHLVAISIALGMIDPNTFIPKLVEAHHEKLAANL
ncbi:MAG: hypothetical protein NVS1B2_16020 [Vulcanimicrobiaceae bacterium]